MHIRVARVKRKGAVREYAQLVESFRRPSDGMPATRVLASLGDPNSLAVLNLRQALAAAREGKRTVVGVVPRSPAPAKPSASLRYLDVAVLLELWRQWNLDALFDRLLPPGESCLPASKVLACLVVQRCLAGGSKLFASRWVRHTALPELLGFERDSFNNTRIHRVLGQVDEVLPAIQSALPHLVRDQAGAHAALFLDVTDTWFVGHGPTMARSGKCKEGMVRRKIGIVLVCNEHNYPLRWEVIEGNTHDGVAMTSLLRDAARLPWLRDVPVVMDRAVGLSAWLQQLIELDMGFLTALSRSEFGSYARSVPFDVLGALDDACLNEQLLAQRAAEALQAHGLTRHSDTLLTLDLGIVDRTAPCADTPMSSMAVPLDGSDPLREAVHCCRQQYELVEANPGLSLAGAARTLGVDRGAASKYRKLSRLSESIQRDILEGGAVGRSIAEMLVIARMPVERQRSAFDALLARAPTRRRPITPARKPDVSPDPSPIRVRAVAYFNPQRFVDQKRFAAAKLARVEAQVIELQQRVDNNPARYTADRLRARVDRILLKESLLDAYRVHVLPATEQRAAQIQLELDASEWRRRRRYDGWTVLVSHPRLAARSAQELCSLYRAKDAVEKDFQIIKSFVQLRPVRHRNDDKVRAHVAVCVLAMVLERSMQNRLRCSNSASPTAHAALELLESCRLNTYRSTGGAAATCLVTDLSPDQRRVLKALQMQHFADDMYVTDMISSAS